MWDYTSTCKPARVEIVYDLYVCIFMASSSSPTASSQLLCLVSPFAVAVTLLLLDRTASPSFFHISHPCIFRSVVHVQLVDLHLELVLLPSSYFCWPVATQFILPGCLLCNKLFRARDGEVRINCKREGQQQRHPTTILSVHVARS